MLNYDSLKNKLLFKKYKIDKILGKGSFGWVYKGKNIIDNSDVAIKAERKDSNYHLLETESNFLSILKGYGIPEIKSYGLSGKFYILVQELLGDNLSQIKLTLNNFTLKDIAMMAIQILDRIEFVHSKNIIHRDIKPENFLIGYRNNSIIYLIDFGISRKFRSSRTGKHIRFSLTKRLFGTVRYTSYNASRGAEQSRRDDLESIGYMLIYLIKGNLPWKGIKLKADNAYKKYIEMLNLKKTISPEDLCFGLPSQFINYIKYCKNLAFEQDPDYEYLRNLFKNILFSRNQINDMNFSWSKTNSENILKLNMNNKKYINLSKRKESPHTRLYRSIQNSLKKDEKSIKRGKYQLSVEGRNILSDRNNVIDNSNLSKDITYNSLLAQYNVDISKFLGENKIFEIFRRKSKRKMSILSLWDKNLFDNKSTEFEIKNFSKERFIEQNNNKIIKSSKKKYSLSNDKKNYIKIYKLSDIKNKVSKSKQIKSNSSKQKLFPNNSNNKKINSDKNNINNEKQNSNYFFKEIKNDTGQKKLNNFNTNKDTFSFKNLNIEENPCQRKIEIEKYNLIPKPKIPKNNNMNLNKYLKYQKLNMNNAMKRAKINSNNNINLNIHTLNKNIQNIIINNNLSNSFRNSPNKIILRNKIKFTSGNYIPINSENKNYLNKDKEENYYDSYNYINKIPNNKYNYEKIKLFPYNQKSNIMHKNNYIHSLNNDISSKKTKNYQNGMKIRVFEYKPLYSENIKSYNTNHNSIRQYNNLKKQNTSFLQSSFSVGKMKIIKLDKNVQKSYKIYNSNNKSINNIIFINFKNNRINGNNYSQRNNIFSNEIKSYDFNPNNIINNNKIYLKNTRRLAQNFSNKDCRRQKDEYDIEIKNEDKRIMKNNTSFSNKMNRKFINFNSDFVEDFQNINHIPKNINNIKMEKNKIIVRKCFNKFEI